VKHLSVLVYVQISSLIVRQDKGILRRDISS
jgi:hypothetical protein